MSQYGAFAASRRAGEYRVRIFTSDLVIVGTVVTMKEKPRLSDTLNEAKAFLNVTEFETYAKGIWFNSLASGEVLVPMEKGTYIAVGKNQVEALHVIDPAVDPEKA